MSGGKPRILVLARSYPNDVFPTLGLWTEQPTVRLAERYDVRVVSPVPWSPPLPHVGRLRDYAFFRRVPSNEVRAGVEIVRPRFLVGPGMSLYAIESQAYRLGITRSVERMQRQRSFDLVHAHFIYPDGAVAHQVARRYGIPFVVTEHAPWVSRWIDRRGVRADAQAAAAEAATVVAVSDHVRDTIAGYTGARARIRVIPNGVDLELFAPGPEAERRPKQVLFVGQINFNKGVDVLLRAVALLAARDPEIRLVLAGDAFFRDQRLQMNTLRALPQQLGLDGQVSFAGQLCQPEIARLMRQSSVLVLPSRAESFGAVLIEALACGTPVVATRCGGPEEIVTDAIGELVRPGDSGALAEAIDRVLDEGKRRPEDLRAHVSARYGIETVVERYAEVYDEALRR